MRTVAAVHARTAGRMDDMIDRQAIGEAIMEGVQAANRRYEAWSRGGWLTDSGAEGPTVEAVGEKLHGALAGDGSIEMQMPSGAVLDWSAARRRKRRPRHIEAPHNRVDIVILDRNWRPVCAVEVNRFWQQEECLEDLERVRDLIVESSRRDGSLTVGFVAFLLDGWEEEDCTARECLEFRRNWIEEVVGEKFDPDGLKMELLLGPGRQYPKKYRVLRQERDWVHAAFCIALWRGVPHTDARSAT